MVNNQDFVVNEAVLKGQPFFIKRGSEGDMKRIDILKKFPPEESGGISLTLKTINMKKSVDFVYNYTYVQLQVLVS